MIQKHYKVVCEDTNNQLHSFLHHKITSHSITYCINEWVYPTIPHSKLFVFSSLKEAFRWKESNSFLCVYECEVRNPQKIKWICSWFIQSVWEDFWNKRYNKKKMPEKHKIPQHTIVVDAVKLIKKIDK